MFIHWNIFNASQQGNLEILKYFIAIQGKDLNQKEENVSEK